MKPDRLDYFRRRAQAGRGRKLITEFIEHIDSLTEKCAAICESMIVGGRAWTEEQAVAADALSAAAKAIRNSTVQSKTPWHVAEQKTLLAALAWHRLDTQANADALHYWCQKAIEARPLCSQPEAPDFVFTTADGARHAIGADGLSREFTGRWSKAYNGDSMIVDKIASILSEELPAPALKKELCLAEDKIREQEADISSLTERLKSADGDYDKATQILAKIRDVTENSCIVEDELRRYILQFLSEEPTLPERYRILRWLRVALQWNANAQSIANAIEDRQYDQLYSHPPGKINGRPAMTAEEYDRNRGDL